MSTRPIFLSAMAKNVVVPPMSASIKWSRNAAVEEEAPLLIVTRAIASAPQPSLRSSSFASQSVSEPAVETPIFLPFSSSFDLMGESHGTPMLKYGMVVALSQTASMGTPFAVNAISVPAPSAISMLPAAMAWIILLPPMKSAILRSIPCFLKKPSWSPTLTTMTVSAVAAALPTMSVVPADAGSDSIAEPSAMASAARAMPRNMYVLMASSAAGRRERSATR